MPYFVYPREGWNNRLKKFFKKHGYEVHWDNSFKPIPKKGTHIVCGNSLKWKTYAHVVVYKNGKLAYDPNFPSDWSDKRITHRLIIKRLTKNKMKNITKEEALAKIEELKKYVSEVEKEEKVVGLEIKTWAGSVLFKSTKTTIKEAVVEAVSSDADLSGADLSGANLRNADLSGANLRNADLSDAYLSGANLRNADLKNADLSGAYLMNADLSGANLRNADLRNADLRNADLSGTEMQNAKFYGKTNNPKTLTKKQLPDFLSALGFKIED